MSLGHCLTSQLLLDLLAEVILRVHNQPFVLLCEQLLSAEHVKHVIDFCIVSEDKQHSLHLTRIQSDAHT